MKSGDWQHRETEWGDVWWVRLDERPVRYRPPFGVETHSLLMWDATFAVPDFPNREMNQLAEDIAAAACAWSVSSGFNASAWDDLIDWVHVEADVEGEPDRWPVETLTVWVDEKGSESGDVMSEAVEHFVDDVVRRGESFMTEPPTVFRTHVAMWFGPASSDSARFVALLREALSV